MVAIQPGQDGDMITLVIVRRLGRTKTVCHYRARTTSITAVARTCICCCLHLHQALCRYIVGVSILRRLTATTFSDVGVIGGLWRVGTVRLLRYDYFSEEGDISGYRHFAVLTW